MLRPLLVVLMLAPLALAQKPAPDPEKAKEDAEAVKKQQKVAGEHLKTIKIAKPTLVETDNLLVYADLKEEAVKPVAEAAQKAYERAVKDLKFGEKDRLWTGKLTLYVLADRTKEYTPFVKLVEGKSGKLDADEMRTFAVKGPGGEPFAAVTASPTSKTVDADLKTEAAVAVADALITQKAGAPVPTWVQDGMGKAIAYRAETGGKSLEAHKAKVKKLFTKTTVGTFKAADVWGDAKAKDADTLAVSLGEYILYGASGEAMEKFLGGFRPGENQTTATTANALEAAEWKADGLDTAWKKWVMGLK